MTDYDYSLFQFASGANPYITITKNARRNVLRRLKRRGYTVTRTIHKSQLGRQLRYYVHDEAM